MIVMSPPGTDLGDPGRAARLEGTELSLHRGVDEDSLDGGVLAAFAERGVTLGMLRHERRLASAADARALAIDPFAPADLAALVRGRLPEPPRR